MNDIAHNEGLIADLQEELNNSSEEMQPDHYRLLKREIEQIQIELEREQ